MTAKTSLVDAPRSTAGPVAVTLPPVKPYDPTTFEERGVAIPFTTPLLGGTRARCPNGKRVELVIPSPAGGRGVYIMPWTTITAWCRPTLHDVILNERIAALTDITPATIRAVGLEVAAEGLAGEEASEAAQLACIAAKGRDRTTNYRLLMTLVAQVAQQYPESACANEANKDAPIKQARATIEWISPLLGQPVTWTANALEALSDVMANIGVRAEGSDRRVPHLLNMLRRTCADMSRWSLLQKQKDQADYVGIICTVAELTLSISQATLVAAWALTDDMLGLLRAWAADPVSVSRLVARPEWLLDGWEQICLIWNNAQDDAVRRAALGEMVGLLPVLPSEASGWSEIQRKVDISRYLRRLAPLSEDWCTGLISFRLIARNEHLRASSCSVF